MGTRSVPFATTVLGTGSLVPRFTMLVVRRLSGALALLLAVSVLGANVTTAAAADIRFEGHGWGHGVGLSQYGAKAMGADGATYDQILHRYFTEISLVPLSSTERGSFLETETMPFWVGLLQDQSGVVFTVSVELSLIHI